MRVPMGLGRLGLFLAGNMGIGPQGESGIVVAQHSGDRFERST